MLRLPPSNRKEWSFPPTQMHPPDSNPLRPAFILRWVCAGAAVFWLGHFINGGLMLALSSEDFTNAHGNEAREHYLGFIIFENLKLLKAYTLATIGYTVCIFPIVWLWMKRRSKRPAWCWIWTR